MVDNRNPLYDFGDEGEGEAPTFNERWGSLPVEAPHFNLTPNVALVESTPKPLKQGTDPVTGRPDLKFVPVDDPWANTPKPIKRLLGVGGEERYQTWPERALRSGLSAPLDAMQGKLPTIDLETGDVARTAMEPNAFGRLLGMKGGWQGVSSEGAIGRAQDVASVGGPGGLMNLREEGVLGSHGGNLVQPTPKVAAPFYSAVEHAVSNIKQDKMPADQWLGTLTNSKGVKPEELDWTGLKDHLAEKGKEPVTKQEVQDYVNANKVELKEVNKGNLSEDEILRQSGIRKEDWDKMSQSQKEVIERGFPKTPTKYSQYQLPGGKNYKEMLMTLPMNRDKAASDLAAFEKSLNSKPMTPDQKVKWNQLRDAVSESKGYTSSHWDEPNVLAHVRTNDRNITAPGETAPKKSLHIEEIQSDLHQQGREKGYKNTPLTKVEENELIALDKKGDEIGWTRSEDERYATLLERKEGRSSTGIPNAPFKKTWHELALKRMIREAAEKGYDRLSWTPGEAQAARYDLSKQVDELYHWKDNEGNIGLSAYKNDNAILDQHYVKPEKLSEVIGKEMAQKILNGEGEKAPKHLGGDEGVKMMTGLDLKVGGEGMKGFYDSIIPKAVEKIGKEHGVRVKQAKIDVNKPNELMNKLKEHDYNEDVDIQTILADNGGRLPRWLTEDELTAIENGEHTDFKGREKQPVHYIDIPESLKNQALGKGFPLFSSGGHLLNPIPGNPHEQVDNSHHVPYGAGASNTPTGFPVNIDKRIPKYDDKLKLPNGKPADLHKYLTIHEIEEYKAMKAGIPYHKAHHDIATPMEKKAVESDGVSWKEYEHIMDGYLKKTEEDGYKNLPPRLYTKPYPHSRSLKMDHGEDNGKED